MTRRVRRTLIDGNSASDVVPAAPANVARTASGPPTATGGRPASSAASLDTTGSAGTPRLSGQPTSDPALPQPRTIDEQLQDRRRADRARQARIDAILARVNTTKPRSGR